MAEWISVYDRLPDDGTKCLVCGARGAIRVARASVRKQHSWWTVVGTSKFFNATHWMPLPEPPKDGDE
ncbi:MAG: DUF551 domain-containing protein [Oscillospiraceae bacterium]|nr:DUF551 domain-containing protein [Oscillospiraceae bacterium]